MTPYTALLNQFRPDLRAGRRPTGCRCSLANPIGTKIPGLAMKHVHAAAQRLQRAIGTLAPVEADAHRYLRCGASFVAVGSDQALQRRASAALREKFRA